jgi:ATP-dependent RNA helicase DDX52/ROK1
MDIFRLLSSGAKFDKKKNQESIDLFKPKTKCIPALSTISQDVKNQDDENQYKVSFAKEDEVNAFRNRLKIKVRGNRIANPCTTFEEMKIHSTIKPIILKNIESSYWKNPTPIQMQAIPDLLNGRDVLAAAPTGSGKTAAYVIPTLSKLSQSMVSNRSSGIRALLLAPTKELADQIFREVSRLCEGRKFHLCNLKKKIMKLALQTKGKQYFDKYDILIATPLRLLSMLRQGVLHLSQVEMIILDEADRLLDVDSAKTTYHNNNNKTNSGRDSAEEEEDEGDNNKGQRDEADDDDEEEERRRERSAFLNQVDEILSHCPTTTNTTTSATTSTTNNTILLQRALFSATIGPFVKELATTFLQDHIEIHIGHEENSGASDTIHQRLIFVGREDGKLLAIRQLIQEGLKPPVLIFVQSIERAKDLFQELIYDNINVDVIHAQRSTYQREEIMIRFRRGDIWVLICTDLMARGIDFQGVSMVINYDLPTSAVSYIHRIGRTGRAGRKGEAITFFTEDDLIRIRPIANVIKLSGCEVPDWMLQIKPVRVLLLQLIYSSIYSIFTFIIYLLLFIILYIYYVIYLI